MVEWAMAIWASQFFCRKNGELLRFFKSLLETVSWEISAALEIFIIWPVLLYFMPSLTQVA